MNGQLIECLEPYFRVLIHRDISVVTFKMSDVVLRVEDIPTVTYRWDRGRWRIPGLRT